MSAALVLPRIWASQAVARCDHSGSTESAVNHIQKRSPPSRQKMPRPEPLVSYAFYRRHTEQLLRRYIYASFQIGRSPRLLGDSVDRGWASSRKITTFEDALIFVIDVESCLRQLSEVDLQLISRVVVQENTQSEAAALLGISLRTLANKLPAAIDRLTEALIEFDLLIIPD